MDSQPQPESQPLNNIGAAMRSMMNRKFIQSQKYKDQQMRAVRDGAHPDILEFEKRLITRMRKQDVPLFCLYLWRGEDEQNALYVRGHSKARYGQSPHNFGLAADIIHGTKAYDLDRKAWSLLGHIGKEISVQAGIPVTWGGDWKFYDPAHWELKNWKALSEKT